MKKILFLTALSCLCFSFAYAQTERDQLGRTYFDEEEKIVKEVFSFREVQEFDPRAENPEVKSVIVKHGAYFKYYESGQLKKSGNYVNDKKNGNWKYYDEEGNIIKSVTFKDGTKVE